MPGGVLLFLPIYHPLHDLGKLHSENTFFMLFAAYLLIIWSADRQHRPNSRPVAGAVQVSWKTALLLAHLVIHYSTFLCTHFFLNPEDEISIGLHETIGNCNDTTEVHTAFGSVSSFVFLLWCQIKFYHRIETKFFYIAGAHKTEVSVFDGL